MSKGQFFGCWLCLPLEMFSNIYISCLSFISLLNLFSAHISVSWQNCSHIFLKLISEGSAASFLIQGTYKSNTGTSLVVQWVRLHAANAGGLRSIPGRGTCMPQLIVCMSQLRSPHAATKKILHAATKTQHSQNKF